MQFFEEFTTVYEVKAKISRESIAITHHGVKQTIVFFILEINNFNFIEKYKV